MQTLVGIIFALSWILCGCTIETIGEGGGPVFLVSFLVMVIAAMVLSDKK